MGCEENTAHGQRREDDPEEFQCKECGGTGMEIPECDLCFGNGWVDDPKDGGTMTCPNCDNAKCPKCDGSGEEPVPAEK